MRSFITTMLLMWMLPEIYAKGARATPSRGHSSRASTRTTSPHVSGTHIGRPRATIPHIASHSSPHVISPQLPTRVLGPQAGSQRTVVSSTSGRNESVHSGPAANHPLKLSSRYVQIPSSSSTRSPGLVAVSPKTGVRSATDPLVGSKKIDASKGFGSHSLQCASCSRDNLGRIARSSSAKREFMRETGYPNGRPGYIVDHIVPLKRGGSDSQSNMQWQTVEAAKAKDKLE